MSDQLGEAADRRHATPLGSAMMSAALTGLMVFVIHELTPDMPFRLGSYRSGIATLAVLLIAILYYVRKRNLWISARWLRLAALMPQAIAHRLVTFDRLESWRVIHVTAGALILLPFWWHTEAAPATPLESVLKASLILLVATGALGLTVQAVMPHEMLLRGAQEVRQQDVDQRMRQLYVEAEETVLGHSEALVRAYLANIRPLLTRAHPGYRFFVATLMRSDPAPSLSMAARRAGATLGAEQPAYDALLAIAERKLRLEHNRFNLRFSKSWLRFHIGLFMMVSVMVVFHVAGVLYFAGI
ncbi:MAG TPA: hypothetical protein VHY56_13995 [Candidatus Binataceae bacterium]|nr:hypothetical protein [Candidatus Binataceae bacterium]